MDSDSSSDGTKGLVAPIVVVSKVRWYVCAMYSYMAFMQGLMWFTFSSIPTVTEQYYKISAQQVDYLLSWGSAIIIVFLPFSAWIASLRKAIKYALIIGAVSQLVGGFIRFVPCLLPEAQRQSGKVGHPMLHIGQIIIAISGPLVFSTPSRVAFEWFPDSEKNIAASLIMNATTLAQAIGYILGPLLAPEPKSVPVLLGVELLMTVPLVVCSLAKFPALPTYPPSAATSAQHAEMEMKRVTLSSATGRDPDSFVVSLKEFWREVCVSVKNLHFVAIVCVFGLYIALLIVWDGLLPQVLATRFSARASGVMGFAAMIMGIVFCQVFGILSDKVFKRKIVVFFCVAMAGTMAFLVLVAMAFPGVFWKSGPLINSSAVPTGVLVTLLGGIFTAPYGLVYILVAEMSYPASESISAVLVSWLESVISIIFLDVWPLCPTHYFAVFTFVGCLICLVAVLFIKTSYSRSNMEKASIGGAGGGGGGGEGYDSEELFLDEKEMIPSINYSESDFLMRSCEYEYLK